jgi:hypothetical protein
MHDPRKQLGPHRQNDDRDKRDRILFDDNGDSRHLSEKERDWADSADINADDTANERGFEPDSPLWYETWLHTFEAQRNYT